MSFKAALSAVVLCGCVSMGCEDVSASGLAEAAIDEVLPGGDEGESVESQAIATDLCAAAMANVEKRGASSECDDAIIAAQRAGSPAKDQFVFLDEALATEPYGLMLPKDDPQFKKFVDSVLVGLMQSGELARIYDKWFMQPIPPKDINLQMPMTEKLKAAIANPNDTPVN